MKSSFLFGTVVGVVFGATASFAIPKVDRRTRNRFIKKGRKMSTKFLKRIVSTYKSIV